MRYFALFLMLMSLCVFATGCPGEPAPAPAPPAEEPADGPVIEPTEEGTDFDEFDMDAPEDPEM